MLRTGLNVDWRESQKFLENYSRQSNAHYGASKLDYHIRNYVENRTDDSTLNLSLRSTAETRSAKYGEVRGSVQLGLNTSIVVKRMIDYEKLYQAKQYIINYDALNGDNEKDLLDNYTYYIANRGKDDKLEVGRVRGRYTLMKDKKLIEAIHGHKCVMCGSPQQLQIHHIDNLKDYQNRDINNQACVCAKCHCEIHGFKYKGE